MQHLYISWLAVAILYTCRPTFRWEMKKWTKWAGRWDRVSKLSHTVRNLSALLAGNELRSINHALRVFASILNNPYPQYSPLLSPHPPTPPSILQTSIISIKHWRGYGRRGMEGETGLQTRFCNQGIFLRGCQFSLPAPLAPMRLRNQAVHY